jgi:hypothetical protein
MSRKLKVIGLILGIIILFYALQLASTAVHVNCTVLKDDCVPPIFWTAEVTYRILHPSWLNQFEIEPVTFSFKDGQFGFWEGEVDGKAVVIRVQKDDSPVMQWIGSGLPLGIPIHLASGEHIQQWLKSHPEFQFSE